MKLPGGISRGSKEREYLTDMVIVQKYGGTSVGNVERIKAVAERVARARKSGARVVVIVSAMSGETDKLITLANQATPNPEGREMDLLLSSGERVSAALTAMAISSLGLKAISLTGRQVGIFTDDAHTMAKIEKITGEAVKKSLEKGFVPVIAGFQGITQTSEVTTLGRGGSDLTAVAIAAALKADLCEIYTDVDGVYTTDPNIVPEARKLEKISYDEMLELASLGAKVLQTRSVEFAKKYDVPVVVRSSFNDNRGTLVVKEDRDMEHVVVSGVAYDKNQSKITVTAVPDKPGVAARLFQAIASANIVVDMIVQNVSSDGKATDISFTVPKSQKYGSFFLLSPSWRILPLSAWTRLAPRSRKTTAIIILTKKKCLLKKAPNPWEDTPAKAMPKTAKRGNMNIILYSSMYHRAESL